MNGEMTAEFAFAEDPIALPKGAWARTERRYHSQSQARASSGAKAGRTPVPLTRRGAAGVPPVSGCAEE